MEFKGYAKWCVLNQVVLETHPEAITLQDLNKDVTRAQTDGIYKGLKQYYGKFMLLTDKEHVSLEAKKAEYRVSLKKSAYLTYLFINMQPSKIRHALGVLNLFDAYCQEIKEKSKNSRLKDVDQMGKEVLDVFVFNLILNIHQKYRSSKQPKRKDGQISAWVASIIVHQYMDKKGPHQMQLEYLLTEITNMHKKIKNQKDCQISENEMNWYIDLHQKVKKGKFPESELIYPVTEIPDEIQDQLKQIEEIDFMKFVEGIDTESLAYRFYNS